MIYLIITIIAIIAVIIYQNHLANKRTETERLANLARIEDKIENAGERVKTAISWETIKPQYQNFNSPSLLANEVVIDKVIRIYGKYQDDDVAFKIFNGQHFLGMTFEMLKDARGLPTKIEENITATKIKIKYIYGFKTSGDVFDFENGLLVKFIDR